MPPMPCSCVKWPVESHAGMKSPECLGPDGGEGSLVAAGREGEAVAQQGSEPEFGQFSRGADLAKAFVHGGHVGESFVDIKDAYGDAAAAWPPQVRDNGQSNEKLLPAS